METDGRWYEDFLYRTVAGMLALAERAQNNRLLRRLDDSSSGYSTARKCRDPEDRGR
jgi:hypothetical protein